MASPSIHRASRYLLHLGLACTAGLTIAEHFYTLKGSVGPSMYPTLQPTGDYLLISRRHRYGRDVGVGDVVAFKNPLFAGEYAAKRVVGLPGDLVLRDAPKGDGARHPADMMIEVRVLSVPPCFVLTVINRVSSRLVLCRVVCRFRKVIYG